VSRFVRSDELPHAVFMASTAAAQPVKKEIRFIAGAGRAARRQL
jgi:hypothetical protein